MYMYTPRCTRTPLFLRVLDRRYMYMYRYLVCCTVYTEAGKGQGLKEVLKN